MWVLNDEAVERADELGERTTGAECGADFVQGGREGLGLEGAAFLEPFEHEGGFRFGLRDGATGGSQDGPLYARPFARLADSTVL